MASKPEEELSDDHERCDDASPPAPIWLDQFGERLSSLMEQAFPPELREVEGGIVYVRISCWRGRAPMRHALHSSLAHLARFRSAPATALPQQQDGAGSVGQLC